MVLVLYNRQNGECCKKVGGRITQYSSHERTVNFRNKNLFKKKIEVVVRLGNWVG